MASRESPINSELLTTAAPGALDWAHPIVREWFLERFESPTEPQQFGWPHILASLKSLLETGESLEETRRWPEGI